MDGAQESCVDGYLHNLVHQPKEKSAYVTSLESTGQQIEEYSYQCSCKSCPTSVKVTVKTPVLTPKFVNLLTNTQLVQKRAEEAIQAFPDRLEGVATPLPINVLLNLRTYIHDALNDAKRSKSINAANKKFMVCFGVYGQPCQELLQFLQFSWKVRIHALSPAHPSQFRNGADVVSQHRQDDAVWEPPPANKWAAVPFRDPLNIFLDDVEHELIALIKSRPPQELEVESVDLPFESSVDSVCQILGAYCMIIISTLFIFYLRWKRMA